MKNNVEITYGDWRASVNVGRGANCIRLINDRYGASILREPPATDELDNPYLYGMPILFPVNRIEGGRFAFEGREYVFPINEPRTNCHLHGELHRTPFLVLQKTENSVLCRFFAEKGEYLSFPHAFSITTEYTLLDDGLYHTVTVENRSKENMPVFLGFHTTFNICFLRGSAPEDIRAYAGVTTEYERLMDVNYLPTGVKPPFDEISTALSQGALSPAARKISRHYRGEGIMSLTDLKNKVRVVYEADEKLGFRLIYSGGEEGYICLEPQNCLANCPNSPFSRREAGFDYVTPSTAKTYRSKIYLEEISL